MLLSVRVDIQFVCVKHCRARNARHEHFVDAQRVVRPFAFQLFFLQFVNVNGILSALDHLQNFLNLFRINLVLAETIRHILAHCVHHL